MILTLNVLRRVFDDRTASRWLACARERRVRTLERHGNGVAVTEIERSGGAVYAQRIRLETGAEGAPAPFA